MACRSTINSVELPLQFRYMTPTPVKRHTVTPTAGGVVIQQAPTIHIQDSVIAWRMNAITEAQKNSMVAFYEDASSPNLTFIGHNESTKTYTVKALLLDKIEVNAGNWSLSGSFQIISVA